MPVQPGDVVQPIALFKTISLSIFLLLSLRMVFETVKWYTHSIINMLFPFESLSVSVIGLGYVGLPLAVAISGVTFDSSFCKDGFASVTGFDISVERIKQLSAI